MIVGFEGWLGRAAFPGWGRCRACEADEVHGLGGEIRINWLW